MTPASTHASGAELPGAAVVRAVRDRLGVRLQESLNSLILGAAAQLVQEHLVPDLEGVVERLSHAPDDDVVVRRMTEAASIGETYFFRGPAQLELLSTLVTTQVIPFKRGPRILRVWSAGCATGEEAYTLCVLFGESLPDWDVQVLGTDMNARALAVAQSGRYGRRSFRSKTAPRSDWVRREGDGWAVAPRLKQSVSFRALNLASAVPPAGPFDVVVCRNVLIYFDPVFAQRAIQTLLQACAPTAILAVTAAEAPTISAQTPLENLTHGLFLKRAVASPRRERSVPRPTAPAVAPEHAEAPAPPTPPAAPTLAETLERARAAADRGRLTDALALAAQAVRLRPDAHLPHYLVGLYSAASGELAGARAAYQRALYLNRELVAAEMGLAELCAREGKVREASRHFSRAVRLLDRQPPSAQVEGLDVEARLALRVARAGAERKDEP